MVVGKAGSDRRARCACRRAAKSPCLRVRQLLVIEMAAFLRQELVLDVNRRGAGVFEAVHHVHDVERLALACVNVDQHRQTTFRLPAASPLSADDILQRGIVQVGFGQELLQLGVFRLELLKPACVVGLYPAVLRLPAIKALLQDP